MATSICPEAAEPRVLLAVDQVEVNDTTCQSAVRRTVFESAVSPEM